MSCLHIEYRSASMRLDWVVLARESYLGPLVMHDPSRYLPSFQPLSNGEQRQGTKLMERPRVEERETFQQFWLTVPSPPQNGFVDSGTNVCVSL